MLAISWLASAAAGERRREFPSEHPVLSFALLVLLGWTLLTALWAAQIAPVEVSTISFALNFALFPIVYSAVRTTAEVRQIMVAFIIGAVLAAAYGVIAQPNASALAASSTAATGLNRLSGTIKDPNELATVLAAGVGLSTALIFDKSRSFFVRAATLGAAGLLLTGILLTALPWRLGRSRRRARGLDRGRQPAARPGDPRHRRPHCGGGLVLPRRGPARRP